MNRMNRVLVTAALGAALCVTAMLIACGGGGESEQPGERITDPARVASSTPIQNPTLFKIQGNEVILTGGTSGQITPVAAITPAATDYIIKQGDFCSTIAADNRLTLDEFMKANRNVDCNALKIGDKVKIPSSAAPTPTRGSLTGNPTTRPGTTGGGGSYIVAAGDTCAGIAAAKGVTLAAFMAANGTINSTCSNLKAGQVVTIP